MSMNPLLSFAHGEFVPRDAIPCLEPTGFRESVSGAVSAGQRLTAFFGCPADNGAVELLAVLVSDVHGTLCTARTRVTGQYPALTPECSQAHWFEREIAEQWGLLPEGHPWLKPIRFHSPCRDNGDGNAVRATQCRAEPGVTDYFRVDGEEIHEVAVGPVHAGIIEPGHFRFQCHGEDVFHLEIELGYQHRGIESQLCGGPDKKTIHYMETAAGDTTIAHTTAYCHNLELLQNMRVPARAQALRGVALELERLANHTGDLGALAGDVGFLPTASFCGRIRGDWLNLTAVLCGNRFGRGLVCPGGLSMDLSVADVNDVLKRVDAIERDLADAVNLLWVSSSVMARFEEAGTVARNDAEAIGLVGPAARACGIERDVRHDFPSGIYRYAHIPVSTWHSGDVFARAHVRWLECQRSIVFVREQLRALAEGEICVPDSSPVTPSAMAVSLVEGWRGEVCHVALTDAAGRFDRYKIVDPSFHNWFGLALSLRNQQIADFPLCNKSFNLSYCGHDL